ncbi:MAG: glycogen/starch/alpha-glucan phosphorylase, partial [Myxococcales bacterium]|nr:glycogen/starch/alpha-glucan phosphorylase [Myxococcales bacterium]
TGNMKFAMNGALTIGTLDGANIEIREAVGPEHFFLFGHDAEQARNLKGGGYRPGDWIARSPRLARVLDLLQSGFFSPGEHGRFAGVAQNLRDVDQYLCCADFDDYLRVQAQVDALWPQRAQWMQSVVHNIAFTGRFSSDRTIREYAADIWKVAPVKVSLD